MTDIVSYDTYLQKNLDKSISELSHFCEQPSIAAQNFGLTECATLTAEMLKSRGFSVQIFSTGGAPVVFGERKGRVNKTILF